QVGLAIGAEIVATVDRKSARTTRAGIVVHTQANLVESLEHDVVGPVVYRDRRRSSDLGVIRGVADRVSYDIDANEIGRRDIADDTLPVGYRGHGCRAMLRRRRLDDDVRRPREEILAQHVQVQGDFAIGRDFYLRL